MNQLEQLQIEIPQMLDKREGTQESARSGPEICVEPDPQVEGDFHGFFAVRLEATTDRSLMKGWKHETELLEQLKFIEGLMALDLGASVQLRYISQPDPENWLRGKLEVALLFHSTGFSDEEAERSTRRLWENVRSQLSLMAGRYEFAPVTDEADLQSLRQPFAIGELAEIARREEVVSLDGREGLYLICPFIPTARDMSRVCKGLLSQREPVMFSVTFRPTLLTVSERQYFEGPLVRRSLATHPGVGPMRQPHEPGGRPVAGLGPSLAAANGVALQTIHVASGGELTSSLLNAIGSEISHPVSAPDLEKDLLERSRSGGFMWQKPAGVVFNTASRSLAYHECTPWMDSSAPGGLERARFLVDPIQGSAAFRLPLADGDGESIPGIKLRASIPFVAPHVSKTGTLIGLSRFGTATTEIRLGPEDRRRHCYLQGGTGSGKTTLIVNMVTQDIQAGHGVIVMDFHGDLSQELLRRIPSSRLEDVIYFNPADVDYPIGLNLLAYDRKSPYKEQQKERIIDCMTSYLKRQFRSDTMGPIFFQSFRNAFHLMMASDKMPATLIDLPLVFLDEEYARQRLSSLPASLARKYWEQALRTRSVWKVYSDGTNISQYVTSKFSSLVDMSLTRNIFGQVHSNLDFREIMDRKKILLCNFSKGLVGGEFAELLSFITLFKIEEAALSRADIPENKRAGCALYIDECQNLQTEHFPQLLSEMRKYGVNITLCNQHFSQLAAEMQDSIIANCGTLVLFRAGVKDAEALEPAFYPFDKRLIVRQSNFHAVVKMLVDGTVNLFTMDTLPSADPEWDVASPQSIIESSRVTYGTKREDVEREVMAKLRWNHTTETETAELNGNR